LKKFLVGCNRSWSFLSHEGGDDNNQASNDDEHCRSSGSTNDGHDSGGTFCFLLEFVGEVVVGDRNDLWSLLGDDGLEILFGTFDDERSRVGVGSLDSCCAHDFLHFVRLELEFDLLLQRSLALGWWSIGDVDLDVKVESSSPVLEISGDELEIWEIFEGDLDLIRAVLEDLSWPSVDVGGDIDVLDGAGALVDFCDMDCDDVGGLEDGSVDRSNGLEGHVGEDLSVLMDLSVVVDEMASIPRIPFVPVVVSFFFLGVVVIVMMFVLEQFEACWDEERSLIFWAEAVGNRDGCGDGGCVSSVDQLGLDIIAESGGCVGIISSATQRQGEVEVDLLLSAVEVVWQVDEESGVLIASLVMVQREWNLAESRNGVDDGCRECVVSLGVRNESGCI